MIILERTHNIIKARIIVSYLQANGIDARLLDAEMGATLPLVSGGVRIAVPKEQKLPAERLIEQAERENQQDPTSS